MENSGISQRFDRYGYDFPLDVMSRRQATSYRRDLETLQQQSRDSRLGNKGQLNNAHVICRFASHVRQVVAPEDFAMLVRGQDRRGHF